MKMTGPIPGENFTSDTKNYPWHRPPEHTDLDKAIEAASKKLLSEESSYGILTMLEMGTTIAQVTDMFVTSGVGAGKWTPDFAILLAGPVSHIIYLMAKGYGVKAELGIGKKNNAPSKHFFEAAKVSGQKIKGVLPEVQEAVPEIKKSFMDMNAKAGGI